MQKIPDVIHESWHKHLQPLFDDEKMLLIKDKILPSCNFYPNSNDIFKVFSMPLQDIKVVILGQDPYPNGEAIGLAFAVNSKTAIPKSLNIIFKEVIKPETSEDFINSVNAKDRTLSNWVNQGVFLLNTALTVEEKNPNSHTGYWQWFTREVIKIISRECLIKPVWMLWGAKAQSFREYIGKNQIDINDVSSVSEDCVEVNFTLQAPHPAAELYSGGKTKFSGCNHFEKCNEILEIRKQEKINW